MKIAVLADIHGNLPALQAVTDHIDRWDPDQVMVAGDIINRGPKPLECLEVIEERQRSEGWLVIRGNHEEYVINHALPGATRSGPRFEIYQTAFWTLNQLNGHVPDLSTMPVQISCWTPDGQEIRAVHASMKNNRDGIYVDTPDDYLRQQIAPPPATLCAGHTHRPLIRTVDDTLVVNVGSVGMPFDGDSRATYAQLTWKNERMKAKIVRLVYDRDRMERDIIETGFSSHSGPLTPLMIMEYRHSRAYLHMWMRAYQKQVLSGTLSVEKAVAEFLADLPS